MRGACALSEISIHYERCLYYFRYMFHYERLVLFQKYPYTMKKACTISEISIHYKGTCQKLLSGFFLLRGEWGTPLFRLGKIAKIPLKTGILGPKTFFEPFYGKNFQRFSVKGRGYPPIPLRENFP